MAKPKLKDWLNADEVGTRFPRSKQLCPKCGQPCQEDRWPPDYWTSTGDGTVFESSGSQKFVCTPCRIAFRVLEYKKRSHIDDGTFMGREDVYRKLTVSEITDLVEKDGFLLTPHDAWREEYRTQNGKYPVEAYA